MGFADKLKALFRRSTLDDEAYEDLADLLVEGDIGAAFAYELVESLKKKVPSGEDKRYGWCKKGF